jgi:hypothetical protein
MHRNQPVYEKPVPADYLGSTRDTITQRQPLVQFWAFHPAYKINRPMAILSMSPFLFSALSGTEAE